MHHQARYGNCSWHVLGIPIHAVTLQNEPEHASPGYPTMRMTSSQQRDLIRDHVGPKFRSILNVTLLNMLSITIVVKRANLVCPFSITMYISMKVLYTCIIFTVRTA